MGQKASIMPTSPPKKPQTIKSPKKSEESPRQLNFINYSPVKPYEEVNNPFSIKGNAAKKDLFDDLSRAQAPKVMKRIKRN
jgi:hypothetical protein